MSSSEVIAGSVKNKVVASDLKEERKKCNFDQMELKVFLGGGQEVFDHKMSFLNLIVKHKELNNTHSFSELDPQEKQTEMWRKVRFIHSNYPELWQQKGLYKFPYFAWEHILQGVLPIGLHYSMFQTAIMTMGSEEQIKQWMPLIQDHKIIGCYAQTELGHGSDVGKLETTATLDKATDEFIIHSPTISSTKFWPGDLGRHSSHAVVFARLKVDGNDYGVQPFLVQLRELNSWKRLDGVQSGDLGPKFGYESKDNGWARFDQVRIPRLNMLMGLAEVEKDGTFSIKKDMRVLYSTMMLIRLTIVCDQVNVLYAALTIAIRYAAVRRQFANLNDSKLERKIIDYQTLQHELTPILAMTIMQSATQEFFRNEFKAMMEDIKVQNFSRMDVLHHLLAGFKSYYSEEVLSGTEKCRRSTGGAGYGAFTGFKELHSIASPVPTYEGDNTVMMLQASRYVFKLVRMAKKEKQLPFPFGYISKMDYLLGLKGKGASVLEMLDMQTIEEAMAVRALYQIRRTSQRLDESKEPSKVKDNETFAQMKLNMVNAHVKYLGFYLCKTLIEKQSFKDQNIKPILDDLTKIVALKSLSEDCGAVYAAGYFAPQGFDSVREALDILVRKIRPHLVPLVETFAMPDEIIPSSIGNSYGDIYEQQLEWAMNSRLNKEDKNGVTANFEPYIKPFLHENIGKAFAKL